MKCPVCATQKFRAISHARFRTRDFAKEQFFRDEGYDVDSLEFDGLKPASISAPIFVSRNGQRFRHRPPADEDA